MPEPVICAVARTPVGKFRGALAGYSAVELGVLAVQELLRRARISQLTRLRYLFTPREEISLL